MKLPLAIAILFLVSLIDARNFLRATTDKRQLGGHKVSGSYYGDSDESMDHYGSYGGSKKSKVCLEFVVFVLSV